MPTKVKYRKYGVSNQMLISNVRDLSKVLTLDTALWVATNAPFESINASRKFLEFLDADNNQRITCDELKTAITWMLEAWENYTRIEKKRDYINLDDISIHTKPGKNLNAAVNFILEYLDKSGTRQITFEDVNSACKIACQMPVSENAVVLPNAADDKPLKEYISDIIKITAGTVHPSGKQGITPDDLQKFIKELSNSPSEQTTLVLGQEKIEKYKQTDLTEQLRNLFDQKNKTAEIMKNIRLVEKALLFQQNIFRFANNFVSFPDLYRHDKQAIFEMGQFVADGRKFNLAVKVTDRAKHALVAKSSNIFLLYVEVTIDNLPEKLLVAVPVTSGGRGNLCIGKRGVFYDINQREYDAQVVDIIENPISFKEAIASPFKRIGKLLTGKIESITTAAEQKLDITTVNAMQAINQDNTSTPPPPQNQNKMSTGGMLVGTGVAVAALGSAAAYIAKTFANAESVLKLVLAILAAVAFVIIMTAVVAFCKLRKRDLSSILEGSGWGINARMRLTFKQGRFFTQKPRFTCFFFDFLKKASEFVIYIVAAGLIVYGIFTAMTKLTENKISDVPVNETLNNQQGQQ